MWMEENARPINEERVREAAATGAETLAVACPFCTVMLDDGVQSTGAGMRVADVATLLAEAVEAGAGRVSKHDRRHPPPGSALIAERAYLELRDRIVKLRFAPGTVLREDELMAELGIGRTPLREAVKRLALERFVAVQPRRGTYVTEVDAAEIVHITEVRVELEAQAAELAARRMDADARGSRGAARADRDGSSAARTTRR